jgi:sigma-B regulation protein RsbU (phosphoserine phosphatase)
MDHCFTINQDLKKQIYATMLIQIEVFHYEKILIMGLGEDSYCHVELQSDKKKYLPFEIKNLKNLPSDKVAFSRDFRKNSKIYQLCQHFEIQALFPIKLREQCTAFLGISSLIPTFTQRQIEISKFIANYIGNMLHNDNLVSNLKDYSDRMTRMLNEMGTLHEITHALESSDNLDTLLEYIMQKTHSVMNAESASLMLVIEETNELEFKIVLGPKATEVKPFRLPIGKGIAGWVAESGKPVLIPDCYSDPRFDPSFDKRSGYYTRTMLTVPMIYKSKTLGVMAVINRMDGNPFDENDQMLFTIFASQAALSIENARLLHAAIEKERLDKELQVAAEIQNLLIPQCLPKSKCLDIAAEYIPCKEVGGDFYDVIKLDNERYIFVVADVSGKGIPGALVVANMQATLRAFLQYSVDLKSVVSKLNEAIIKQTTADRYITFFIGIYDHSTQQISYINAGHNPPVLVSKNGEITELRKGGVFIGYVPWEYESGIMSFREGDTLVMYTDGLVEAMNEKEEEFEFDRLKDLLKNHHSENSQKILDRIFSQVKDHIGSNPMEDDFTLLVSRRL